MHNISYKKYNDYFAIEKIMEFPQILQIRGKFENLD